MVQQKKSQQQTSNECKTAGSQICVPKHEWAINKFKHERKNYTLWWRV